MTKVLRPHQAELVELLTSPSAPRALALVAPPWTGGQTALAAAASTIAAGGGLVVVVTSLRLLADQWVSRLEANGTMPIVAIRDGSDLRLTLSGDPAVRLVQGAVVATDRGLGIGSLSKKLDLRPDLLILDGADGMAAESVAAVTRIQSRARNTVARTLYAVPQWFAHNSYLDWSPAAVVPDRKDRYSVHRVPYEVPESERELINRASAFLEPITGLLPPEAVTRYGVQRRLARVEAAGREDGREAGPLAPEVLRDDQRRLLADLLDSFDELGADPRLDTLRRLVNSARSQRRPAVVVVEALRELVYVVGFLRDSVSADIRELTSRLRADEIAGVVGGLANGETVVTSGGMLRNGDELPNGCWNIWWSVPRTAAEADALLGVGFSNSGIQVHVPLAKPPLTSRSLAIDSLFEGAPS